VRFDALGHQNTLLTLYAGRTDFNPHDQTLTFEDKSSPVNPRTPTASHPAFFAISGETQNFVSTEK
jgi:hypothetical protein